MFLLNRRPNIYIYILNNYSDTQEDKCSENTVCVHQSQVHIQFLLFHCLKRVTALIDANKFQKNGVRCMAKRFAVAVYDKAKKDNLLGGGGIQKKKKKNLQHPQIIGQGQKR